MTRPAPSRAAAVGLGTFATLLWAVSWVFIKLGLDEEGLDPIGFAGLRYGMAALVLLPLALPGLRAARVWEAGRQTLVDVLVYGVVLFGVVQATQFVALGQLPAATVGLFIAMAPVVTVVLALRSRHEPPGPAQLVGIAVLVVGAVVFFGPRPPPENALLGVVAAVVMMLAVGGSARLGRSLAVDSQRAFGGVVGLTAVAMAAGALATLAVATLVEGIPSVTPTAWLYLAWMAIANGLAFSVWTHTLRTLTAVESSVLADVTVVHIAFLAWVVLGESLDVLQVAGLTVALVGILVVQVLPLRQRGEPVAEATRLG